MIRHVRGRGRTVVGASVSESHASPTLGVQRARCLSVCLSIYILYIYIYIYIYIYTRRMLSIMGERELRLHSE